MNVKRIGHTYVSSMHLLHMISISTFCRLMHVDVMALSRQLEEVLHQT